VAEAYATHKVVTAHLRKSSEPCVRNAELEAMGEVLECDDLIVRVRVPRPEVAQVSARILEAFPVADLVIEEMDIGTIIERIFRERGEALP
jgi:ABC-type uncharacterized transport system ATPase subunit